MLISPAVTVGIVYLLNRLRYEILMSQHFFHVIKKYQDSMSNAYKRGTARGGSSTSDKNSTQQPPDAKSAYRSIEEEKEAAEQARLNSLAQQTSNAASHHQQPQMRNIDPFEKKRRQAMQDKLDDDFSSRKITSRRED